MAGNGVAHTTCYTAFHGLCVHHRSYISITQAFNTHAASNQSIKNVHQNISAESSHENSFDSAFVFINWSNHQWKKDKNAQSDRVDVIACPQINLAFAVITACMPWHKFVVHATSRNQAKQNRSKQAHSTGSHQVENYMCCHHRTQCYGANAAHHDPTRAANMHQSKPHLHEHTLVTQQPRMC